MPDTITVKPEGGHAPALPVGVPLVVPRPGGEVPFRPRRSQIFLDARRYVLEHGWLKHTLGHHGGPRCAVGALQSAILANGLWELDESIDVDMVVRSFLGRSIESWNDEPDRKVEDVLNVFKTLAEMYAT